MEDGRGKYMYEKITKSKLMQCLQTILPEEEIVAITNEIIDYLLNLEEDFDFKSAEDELYTDLIECLDYDNVEIDRSSARFFIYTILTTYRKLEK